jgi:hypothetical protein
VSWKDFHLGYSGTALQLTTAKVVMGLPVSIFWGNTIDEWVILVDNDCPNVVGEEWE